MKTQTRSSFTLSLPNRTAGFWVVQPLVNGYVNSICVEAPCRPFYYFLLLNWIACFFLSYRHRVVVSYPPQSEAELELKEGDIVFVHKKREDGWFKGTLQRNGKTGLFPGSFVENIWDWTLRKLHVASHGRRAQSGFAARAHLWTCRSSSTEQKTGTWLQSPRLVTPGAEWRRPATPVWVPPLWVLMCKVCLVLSNGLYR